MADRGDIMTWLEACGKNHEDCSKRCPFLGNPWCREDLMADALELLKEPETIPVDTKIIGTSNGDVEVYCCRDCRTVLDPAFHYCPHCGRAVKWE